MKKFIFYIIIAWSLLAFVGYNVLSAEAKEFDKDEYVSGITPDEDYDAESYSDDTREMNKDYCAREYYYDLNEKFCDKLEKGDLYDVLAKYLLQYCHKQNLNEV